MTIIAKTSLVALIGSSMLMAAGSQLEMYGVKSGKITYEIKGSGSIMGSKMQTVGKKRVIFDDNGALNLTEENKIEKQTIMGQKKTTKSHTMTYMKNGMVYHVNFDNKRIMRMENVGAGMAMLMGGEQNMKQAGEDMMKQMGGKKIGTDKVLGYTCDVWKIMGSVKQCMYKGIPLRVETNVMGLKTTEVANKAEFDISLSKDDFKLPDFPIYDMEGNKLDKNSLDALDSKQNAVSSAEQQQLGNMKAASMKAMNEMGYDPMSGKEMTYQQEKQYKQALMNAMGGEDTLLEKQKKEMLGEEKVVRFFQGCLSDANTLKAANACNQKANSMTGETEEDFTSWNASTKKETLSDINAYLGSFDCIKGANSFQALRQCMPQQGHRAV